MSQPINITLGANKSVDLPPFIGKYIKCLSATSTFTLSADGNKAVDFKAGRWYLSEEPINRVVVKDTSGSSNTIQFWVGNDRLGDEDISGILSSLETQQADLALIKKYAHGTSGVSFMDSTTTSLTQTFQGINVLAELAVVSLRGSDLGTDLNGKTLKVGYHPVDGTGINVTGNNGQAYLVHE